MYRLIYTENNGGVGFNGGMGDAVLSQCHHTYVS